MERQKLVLEYVKVAAVILGFGAVVYELQNAEEQKELARLENSMRMIEKFGENEIIDGASAVFENADISLSGAEYMQVMRRASPLRQHLIVWASCVQFELCDDGASQQLLCRRLLSYEGLVRHLHITNSLEYEQEKRDDIYFGWIDKCAREFPEFEQVAEF